MECKNIECNNETIGKRVYCSLTCRNIFVNKYLRNYDKCSNTFKEKRKIKEKEYLKNPKKCKECSNVIKFSKFIDKDQFCNHSCSSSFNNKFRKGTKHNLSESGRKALIESACKNLLNEESRRKAFENQNKKYNRNPEKQNCIECNKLTRNKKYCSMYCKSEYMNRNMDEYKRYKLDCNFKFNLSDHPDEFDFSLIREHGWYSPSNKNNNLGGVSRDHMLSVREGFELGIDVKVISHPANCKLMIHNQNISKNKKSSITLEELMERINLFNNKYKNKTN